MFKCSNTFSVRYLPKSSVKSLRSGHLRNHTKVSPNQTYLVFTVPSSKKDVRTICTMITELKYISFFRLTFKTQRVFTGTMKDFRHTLMDHEIYLETFDGPQNIFYVFS